MPLSRACPNRSASHAERGEDLYETPAIAVTKLLDVEPLPLRLWEPAAGRGAIVDVLRANGYRVYATDLHAYAPAIGAVDFLQAPLPLGCEGIVTNPPFKLAHQFVEHALEIGTPKVVMLMRLAFLESERRSDILEGGKLARFYVFRRRLPMMHRDGWDGPRASSAMAFAWFVWEQVHSGPPTFHRI